MRRPTGVPGVGSACGSTSSGEHESGEQPTTAEVFPRRCGVLGLPQERVRAGHDKAPRTTVSAMSDDIESPGVLPTIERIRLSGPTELLQMVPYLIGFEPTNSLVLIGLAPPRFQVVVTCRVDVEAPVDELTSWFQAAVNTGADCFVAVVYDDQAWPSQPDLSLVAPTRSHSESIAALESQSSEHGLFMVDALLVCNGRWWSYTCENADCCPPDGTPLETSGAVAAAAVSHGMVAAAEREDLVREVEADPERVASVQETIDGLSDAEFVSWTCGQLNDPARGQLRQAVSFVEEHVRRFRESRVPPSDRDTARVLLSLRNIRVRDAVIATCDVAPDSPDVDFWRFLTRVAPSLLVAPPATIYALCAYGAGNGARANVGLDRVFEDEPDYRLAHLLAQALQHGIAPDVVSESLLEGASRERQRLFRNRRRRATNRANSKRRRK